VIFGYLTAAPDLVGEGWIHLVSNSMEESSVANIWVGRLASFGGIWACDSPSPSAFHLKREAYLSIQGLGALALMSFIAFHLHLVHNTAYPRASTAHQWRVFAGPELTFLGVTNASRANIGSRP